MKRKKFKIGDRVVVHWPEELGPRDYAIGCSIRTFMEGATGTISKETDFGRYMGKCYQVVFDKPAKIDCWNCRPTWLDYAGGPW